MQCAQFTRARLTARAASVGPQLLRRQGMRSSVAQALRCGLPPGNGRPQQDTRNMQHNATMQVRARGA